MIKYKLVDVSAIEPPSVPQSRSSEEIEHRADLYLNSGVITAPLILKEFKPENFRVIHGFEEYYVALRAKQKDLDKAEMVNAFVLDLKATAEEEAAILAQVQNTIVPVRIDKHQTENNTISLDLQQFSQALQVIQSQNAQILKLIEAQGNDFLKRIEQIEQSIKSQFTPERKESRASSTKSSKIENLTVPELKDKCREYGITGYSKMKKAELVARLKGYSEDQNQEKSVPQEVELSTSTSVKESENPITSYDAFVKESKAALKKLDSDYQLDNLVPIYRLRRVLSDQVDRTQFNEWLMDMQANDLVQLIGGEVPNMTPDMAEDSLITESGSMRFYVKVL
ncbi:MAG: SAP domain-containing protein [Candidatus Nanopelagicales bacterium]